MTYLAAMLLILFSEQLLLLIFDPVEDLKKNAKYGARVERIAVMLIAFWNRTFRTCSSELEMRKPEGRVRGLLVHRTLVLASLSFVFLLGGVGHGWALCRPAGDNMIAEASVSAEFPPGFSCLDEGVFFHSDDSVELISFHDNQAVEHDGSKLASPCRKIWQLRIAGTPVTASICGPINGWPDLQREFESAGWKVLEAASHPIPELSGNEAVISQMTRFRRAEQQHVLTAAFEKSGVPVAVPKYLNLSTVKSGLGEQLLASGRTKAQLWTFQVIVQSDRSLDSATNTFWVQEFRSLLQGLLETWKRAS
jgi:hypothetical protein